MFFEPDRILAVREMILSDDEAGRRRALAKILPMQRSDFEGIFRAMDGLPVTIRLLDPPLHEFLPHTDEEMADVAEALEVDVERRRAAQRGAAEFNPMLGHRGCRLAHHLPGDLRDAGAGDHRSRRSTSRRRARPSCRRS